MNNSNPNSKPYSKLIIFISFITVVIVGIGSIMVLSDRFSQPNQDQIQSDVDLPVVYTSTYPLYSITAQLLEGVGQVKMVTTTGDVHDFEPSTRDIADLSTSKAFVYNGGDLDTWVEDFRPQLTQNGLSILNASTQIELLEATEGHGHHSHDDEDHSDDEDKKMEKDKEGSETIKSDQEHSDDPHYWLSPAQMIVVNNYLFEQFKILDFGQDQVLQSNYNSLKLDLENLDQDFRNSLGTDQPEACSQREVLLSHNFLQYVSRDYGFDLHTLLGSDPEGEPSIAEIKEIIEEIQEEGLVYILQDGEVNESLINQIVSQTGITRLDFATMERVPQDYDQTSYIQIQQDNLDQLKTAMGCQN
jgi:zinc transport system substrate-binding protein